MMDRRQDLTGGVFVEARKRALNEEELRSGGVVNVREFMSAPYGPNFGKEVEERACRLMAQAQLSERQHLQEEVLALRAERQIVLNTLRSPFTAGEINALDQVLAFLRGGRGL